jgi:hypothetical protein
MIIKATRVRARGPALKRLLDHLENADDNEEVEALRGNFADLYDARQDARNFGREYCVRQWIVSPSRETSYAKMLEAVDRLASEFRFNPARAVVRGHMKTKVAGAAGEELFARHLHILVPEVDPVDDGRVLSSSHDWARGEKVGKILSVEWGCEPLVESAKRRSLLAALKRDGRNDVAAAYQEAFPDSSTRPRPVQSFDTAAQQRLKRKGFDLPALRAIVSAAWEMAPTRDEFEMNLLEHGLVTRAGEKTGVFVIETSGGENVGSLSRLAKITKAAVLAKMEQHDVRPPEEAADDAGGDLQEHPVVAENVGADKASGRTSAGHAPAEPDLDAGGGAAEVPRIQPADGREAGQNHRDVERAGNREGGAGYVEGLNLGHDFQLAMGLAPYAGQLQAMLALANRHALSQDERVVIEFCEIEDKARSARAMIDTPPPEPTSLIEARARLKQSTQRVDALQSAVDGTSADLERLQQSRPWWRLVLGVITGENVRHAANVRAATLRKGKAQAALTKVTKDRMNADNRLTLAIAHHKDSVRDHIKKWTEIANSAEARLAAVASARELWQRLPGVAGIGPTALYKLGVKFARKKRTRRHGPRGAGEQQVAVRL